MAFLSPDEEIKIWTEKGVEDIKDNPELIVTKKKKDESNIPDWKIPEVEPFENIFVSRRDWGAGPHVEGHRYLEKPILFVRFWKYTDTASCTTKDKCIEMVKLIQARHKEKGFGDITHNFLLGGDGNVYEGRGWDHRAPKDTRYIHDKHRYMDVAFIGDERNGVAFYDAAWALFNHGFINKLIDKEYFQVEWGQEAQETTSILSIN